MDLQIIRTAKSSLHLSPLKVQAAFSIEKTDTFHYNPSLNPIPYFILNTHTKGFTHVAPST